MRRDFKLDDRKVYLPSAHTFGFGRRYAKRGDWVTAPEGFKGRSLGRVTCDRKTYVYAVGFKPSSVGLMVRWIPPEEILHCTKELPKEFLKLMMMSWTNLDQIIDELNPYLSNPLEKGNQE